jgi:cytochrome P450
LGPFVGTRSLVGRWGPMSAAALAELELPEYDELDPTLRGPEFDRHMAELAADSWIVRGKLGYVVLDRESGEHFLRSKRATFPGKALAEMFEMKSGALGEEVARNILHIDGDDHRRLRSLVNPAFTPRAADRWRPAMSGFIAELFEAIDGASCEAVGALTKPYPAMTIATVVGAPIADADRLATWSRWIQLQFDGPTLAQHRDEVERACEELYAYLDVLVTEKRAAPGDDLLSTLIAARDGDDRLDDAELRNLVLNVLVGGVDTTQSQLAHALRLFAAHPEQWELLGREPEHAANAVSEVIRVAPVTPFTARIVLQEFEHRGVAFPEGTIVLVCAHAANRDAASGGAGFDITRTDAGKRALTFGAGVHYCLGANLARAELEQALAHLAPRMPSLALGGEPAYDSVHGVYGLDALPLRWEAAAP